MLLTLIAGCGRAVHSPPASLERFGLGREATPAEIAALDTDVMPDGAGLPPGSGTVARGATIYQERCASCHGVSGREGPLDVLVGRTPPEGYRLGGGRRAPPITIGNYWPYAATLFDYVRRAMPWQSPGSLTANETYSLVAWLLFQNEIIAADATLDAKKLPSVKMPAVDRFFAADGAQR